MQWIHVNCDLVADRPRREAYPLLPPGRGRRGGSPCRGGVENGGPWWPEWASKVAVYGCRSLLRRHQRRRGRLEAVAGDPSVVGRSRRCWGKVAGARRKELLLEERASTATGFWRERDLQRAAVGERETSELQQRRRREGVAAAARGRVAG